MRELLFRAWVWTLGLLLAGIASYGLGSYPPDTVTQHMIDHEGYRVALFIAVVLQSVVWFACLYAKRARGWLAPVVFALLTASVVTWLALTTVLTTATHNLLVVVCMLTFVLFAAALTLLLGPAHQHAARVLELTLLLLVGGGRRRRRHLRPLLRPALLRRGARGPLRQRPRVRRLLHGPPLPGLGAAPAPWAAHPGGHQGVCAHMTLGATTFNQGGGRGSPFILKSS
jgi:hypothetical protein